MEDWVVPKKFGTLPKGSEPKFILFLKGKIVDVIVGANTPALTKSVSLYCPLEFD